MLSIDTLDDLKVYKFEVYKFFREFLGISQILDATTAERMKIDQHCQQQRCKHVKLEQFLASRGFVSNSWAFLLYIVFAHCLLLCTIYRLAFCRASYKK